MDNFSNRKYDNKPSGRWKSLAIFSAGLLITILSVWFTYSIVEEQAQEEFVSVCNEIQLKTESRLHAHVLILQAGSVYFEVSDTVTRAEWQEFIERSEIEKNLPGIQGVGYSTIIPPEKLEEHEQRIRDEGFPDYHVYPEGERDIYTSIIYLEPFRGRNLRAFGFDMYSEPVRRRAMEFSRDYNIAALTGKVDLVQETGQDIQAGTLMYAPVYEPEMPLLTIAQRRAAIRGWVYSPYRMDDLMQGILGRWDEMDNLNERIHLRLYDDSIAVSSLLFDSQKNEPAVDSFFGVRTCESPINFNGTDWMLLFMQPKKNTIFYGGIALLFFGGVVISLLLYLLSLSFIRIDHRSAQIRQQNDELHRINATKDKFFSIIAHDLKSPFNTIVGFSNMLLKHVRKNHYEGAERVAKIIHHSATNAMDLLMNLMEWSQSQTGRMRYNPVNFDMVKLVQEVETLFTSAALQKSIAIEKDMPDNAYVTADQPMISTVLRNLISNAIKYTESGGKVSISLKTEPQKLVVKVADTGVGIPEKQAQKLFRVDETFSTTGTQNEKGTGLGLVLCKEFIDFHDGEIGVDSTAGKGSTFFFSIPSSERRSKGKIQKTTPFSKIEKQK